MTAGVDTLPVEGRWRRAWAAIDERLGLSGLAYPVPAHANGIGYILGGITFFGFLILAATGIWLAQFYHATPATARESVVYIMNVAPVGDLVRGVHFWVANVVMATVLLHMGRVFATGSYKRPREANWLIGVGLLAVTLGLIFTGTVLKWDQEGFEALSHNVEVGDLLGAFGFWFSADFTDSVSIITRQYIAHVSILPMFLIAVLAVHMLLIKRHRVSPLPWGTPAEIGEREASEPSRTFTSHLRHIGLWSLVLLGLALLASGLLPAGVGPSAIEGIEITKPPWWFLWLYPFEGWIGLSALYIVPGILVAGLLAIPFLDRSAERDPRRRKRWMVLGAVVLLAWLVLTIYGAVTVPVSHVGGE